MRIADQDINEKSISGYESLDELLVFHGAGGYVLASRESVLMRVEAS